MRTATKIRILSLVFAARVCIPGMAATTEICAFGDPKGTAASQCKDFIDRNTDRRCDKAADSILGVAAAPPPCGGGRYRGYGAQEAPLPMAVAPRAIGIAGYFAVRGLNHKWALTKGECEKDGKENGKIPD